jgi:L-amino acid N-acyltransferase YncA
MILRDATSKDAPQVNKIHEDYHKDSIGVYNHNLCLGKSVVENEGKVLGYGTLQILGEAIMELDLSASLEDRVQSMKLLLSSAITAARMYGIEQVHVFVEDEKLASILTKHFGFEEASGKALVLGTQNG